MKKQPKITIITVTYNLLKAKRKEMFAQNVESVQKQTYKNIEHIVIDGASTDGTVEMLEEYQKQGLIKYYSEPDKGIYDAMNKGIKKAKGKYITFLNSDDFYHKTDGIKRVVDFLCRKEMDFCYSPVNYIYENGKEMGIFSNEIGCWFVRMPFSHQSLFVKKSLMEKLKGFDDKHFKSAGDYDFVMRMIMCGAIGYEMPYNFVNFRLGGFSDTQQQKSVDECIKSFEKNYKKLCPNIDAKTMFIDMVVPTKLYDALENMVSTEIKQKMKNVYNSAQNVKNNYKRISCIPYIKIQKITKIKLFCFLTVIKCKLLGNVKKISVLGLPIVKIYKKSESSSLLYFCGIPILKVTSK